MDQLSPRPRVFIINKLGKQLVTIAWSQALKTDRTGERLRRAAHRLMEQCCSIDLCPPDSFTHQAMPHLMTNEEAILHHELHLAPLFNAHQTGDQRKRLPIFSLTAGVADANHRRPGKNNCSQLRHANG
jgi:hypothetical protein